MFTCTSTSNEVRTFATYDEAYRFVMAEGDMSRLWTMDGPGVAERNMARAIAAATRMGFTLAFSHA